MSQVPRINVQLIHIQGPMKGEIQTFDGERILIGRHPDCDLQFPKDLVIISRRHAEIIREGNRFRLRDQSTNGTFVNGKQVEETFLKDGDVITFAEDGPKVSFLTETVSAGAIEQTPAPKQPTPRPEAAPPQPPTAPAAAPEVTAGPEAVPVAEPVNVPFAVQYGPALKSFRSLPLVIGAGPDCDFPIDHPGLDQKHAQIFFARDKYWIKDLTGQAKIRVNDQPVQGATALDPDVRILLSPDGPAFRFIGGGRLVELETPADPGPPGQVPGAEQQPSQDLPQDVGRKASSLFKKFFS